MRFAFVFTIVTMCAGSAAAVSIDARTTNLVPGQGYVSPFSGNNAAGLFEERYNTAGAPTTCKEQRPATFQYGVFQSDVPSDNNHLGTLGVVSTRQPHISLPPGTNAAFAAANPVITDPDRSCYAFGSDGTPSLMDYPITVSQRNIGGAPTSARYFGMFLGSIDEYNTLGLFAPDRLSQNDSPIIIPGLSDPSGFFTGQQLTSFLRVSLYSSQYIEFFFTAAENFSYITLDTSFPGIEFDNLATSYTALTPSGIPSLGASSRDAAAIPEPSVMGLMLSGLGLVTALRRIAR